MRTLLYASLFAALLSSAPAFASEDGSTMPPLMLYGVEFTAEGNGLPIAKETEEAIRRAVAPRKLVVSSVKTSLLDQLIRSKKADIVITGAAVYRRHLLNGMRDIATLYTRLQPDPDHAAGSLVLTRDEPNGIRSLPDIRGKRIATDHRIGFQGVLTVKEELYRMGYDPDPFFSRAEFYGSDLDPLKSERLKALREGRADVAIVNSCWPERAAAAGVDLLKGLRVVGLRENRESKCLTSTRLYPNWSILISPTLDVKTIRKISDAVRAMPENRAGEGWAIASDFREMDSLYRDLKAGPYEYLRDWSLEGFLRRYGEWFALGAVLLLLLLLHSVRTTHLVRVRTKQLQEALEAQKKLSLEVEAQTRRYEASKRSFAVSQVSSLVAHELAQPLSAILFYGKGLRNLVKKDFRNGAGGEAERLDRTLGMLMEEAGKAEKIVKDVRLYAKTGRGERKLLDIRELALRVRREFLRSSGLSEAEVPVSVPQGSVIIRGSSLELELCLLNILRNAGEALGEAGTVNPEIRLGVMREGEEHVLISVADNGPGMTEESLARIREPLSSGKPSGLGLGLSIARSIAEAHLGTLSVRRNSPIGIRVEIRLPVEKETEAA